MKLTSESHRKGYDIIEIIPSGDGPLFMQTGWQFPAGNGVATPFYNNPLVLNSSMTMEEDCLHETLKKVVNKTPARKTGKASRKYNRKAK